MLYAQGQGRARTMPELEGKQLRGGKGAGDGGANVVRGFKAARGQALREGLVPGGAAFGGANGSEGRQQGKANSGVDR